MTALTPGSAFPADVTFTYIAPTGTLDLKVCGLPTKYDASKGTYPPPTSLPYQTPIKPSPTEFQTKKVVLVAVPGAFTPTCQEQHITSYLAHLGDLKAKGVDNVIFIASNDAFVMSAWGKANGIKDDSIVCCFSHSPHPTHPLPPYSMSGLTMWLISCL
jgi:alkyl hydroperoxide reductase 1